MGRTVLVAALAPMAVALACARGPASPGARPVAPDTSAVPQMATAAEPEEVLPPHDRDADAPAASASEATPTAPTPTPDAAALTGTWAGTYFYTMTNATGGAVGSVSFFADLTIDGGKLRGSVIEPNTIGDRTTNELHAKIEGTIGEDGLVRFVKTYDGAGGVDHGVEYVGRLDVVTQQIEGVWKVTGSEGRFVMRRHNRLPELAMR